MSSVPISCDIDTLTRIDRGSSPSTLRDKSNSMVVLIELPEELISLYFHPEDMLYFFPCIDISPGIDVLQDNKILFAEYVSLFHE